MVFVCFLRFLCGFGVCLHRAPKIFAELFLKSDRLRPQAHRRFLWFFLLRLSCQKKEHLSTKHLKQRLQIFSHPRRHSTFLFEQRGTKRKVLKRKMPFWKVSPLRRRQGLLSLDSSHLPVGAIGLRCEHIMRTYKITNNYSKEKLNVF